MKIAIDLRVLSGKPSGIGIYAYQLVKLLMTKDDIKLVCFTDVINGDEIEELYHKGLDIRAFGNVVNNKLGLFKYWEFIDGSLEALQCQVFWEPNFIILKNIKKKNSNIKVITTIHDLIPILEPKYFPFIYHNYFKVFLKKTLKYTDAVMCISEDAREKVLSVFPEVEDMLQEIVYPIVDTKDINDNRKQENYFLYIGSIEKRKGIDILLDAFEKYIVSGGMNNLFIAGSIKDKKLEKRMKDIIAVYPKRCKYLGYINDGEKNSLIQLCSALVLPSYAEGFGIPPMEALKYCKPIILSDIQVFKEIYKESANYFESYKEDEKKSSENLLEIMKTYKSPRRIDVETVLSNYDAKKMLNKMMSFLDRIVKNK